MANPFQVRKQFLELSPSTSDKHFLLCVCVCVCVFRATPATYGSSQTRGQIGTGAAGLHHSNVRSKPHLRPTPQLMATWDS